MSMKHFVFAGAILLFSFCVPFCGFGERKPIAEEYRSAEAIAAGAFDKADSSRVEVEYDSTETLYRFLMRKWGNEPIRLEWLIKRKQDYGGEKGFYRILLDGEEIGAFKSPVRMEIIAAARGDFDMKNGNFRYDYALHGKKRNLQKLSVFLPWVDQREVPVSEIGEPPKWAHDWNDDFAQSTPKKSYWRFWRLPYAEWKKGEIPLSESVEGFSICSPGLPAILKYEIFFRKKNPVVYFTKGYHTYSSVQEGTRILTGKTIGPAAPPDPFDSQKFLERLSSIIDESLKEGWIEDKKVAQNLKKGLESARDAYGSGDKKRLESRLRDLLKKVEEEKDRSLLSEAYALLKYNVQYWLGQLE